MKRTVTSRAVGDRALRGWAIAAGLLATATPSHAAPTSFALVIGVNRPLADNDPPLMYADDDAVLSHRLFASLGVSVLLTDPDRATQRLHGDLSFARPPTRENVVAALSQLFAKIRARVDQGEQPHFYFVYSGHGDVKNNRGHLALADGILDAETFETLVLERAPTTNVHVIIDSCGAYYMVSGRRPGGSPREVHGGYHVVQSALQRFPHVGFLLSTSSGERAHEWSEFEAGIFSHEIRSGLLGAADVDRDRVVSYQEMWSFLLTANDSVPTSRFRPRVFVRPPRNDGTRVLGDTRKTNLNRVTLASVRPGRYFLEDQRGVRLADFNSADDGVIDLWWPSSLSGGDPPLFLEELHGRREFRIVAPARGQHALMLAPRAVPARSRPRGAAHHAFAKLFVEPYGASIHNAWIGCQRGLELPFCGGDYFCTRCGCPRCDDGRYAPRSSDTPVSARQTEDDRSPSAGSEAMLQQRANPSMVGRPPWLYGAVLRAGLVYFGKRIEGYSLAGSRVNGIESAVAVAVEGELFPGSYTAAGRSARRGFGVPARFRRSVAAMGGALQQGVTLTDFSLHALYRSQMAATPRSPILQFGLGFGFSSVHPDGKSAAREDPLLDLSEVLLRIRALQLRLPVNRPGTRDAIRVELGACLDAVFIVSSHVAGTARGTKGGAGGQLTIGATGAIRNVVVTLQGFLGGDARFAHDNGASGSVTAASTSEYGASLLLGYEL